MITLFGSSHDLEVEIEAYLQLVPEVGLLFEEGMKEFLSGDQEAFSRRVEQIKDAEHKGDELRRTIKTKLYVNMLIPDSRGDVLGLLETMDDVLDNTKFVSMNMDIQRPSVPEGLHEDFLRVAEFTRRALDELAMATRAFFSEIKLVNDHIHKVFFFETEVDHLEETMKRWIFQVDEDMSLAEKMQIRYFVEKVASLTDRAESVGERLAVYSIKREL